MKRDFYASIDNHSENKSLIWAPAFSQPKLWLIFLQINLIDKEFEDINMAEVNINKKWLKNFLEFSKEKNPKEGPLELLRFITHYGFQN